MFKGVEIGFKAATGRLSSRRQGIGFESLLSCPPRVDAVAALFCRTIFPHSLSKDLLRG